MMDLLQTSATWLVNQFHAHASREVVYVRGTDQWTVNATIGRTAFDIVTGDGASIRAEHRDYIIRVVDLDDSGTPIVPAEGDRVLETVNGTAKEFAVAPRAAGLPMWEWADAGNQTAYRIHTVEVKPQEGS